ncbi:MAG TPA: T9SS type A sorting domain-containing protein, partial [Aequorivita sp.]|nr:T9SS type A sorting domain-containing protein [Aequorivita sp.]
GNYTASASAILATELHGPIPGTEYDVFDVQGNASLDGNILLYLTYAANLNDEFVILIANNITSCNLPTTVTANHEGHDYTFDVICNPKNITLKVSNIVLGTEENSLSTISIYPNPSKGHFTINLGKEYADVSVQIYNMLGQTISWENYASTKTINKEITGPAGIYFVRVNTAEERSTTLRIIKQ